MKRLMYAILSVLDSQIESMNSVRIASELGSQGINLSERSVRYYLRMLDARGFTAAQGRKGGRSPTRERGNSVTPWSRNR
jgi:hypothetical protein